MKSFFSFSFLFISIAQASSGIDLPRVDLPSVDEQIKHYRQIFKPYNHAGFDTQHDTQHIEGLEKMLKIGVSFTHDHLRAGGAKEESINDLKDIWSAVCQAEEGQNLTLRYYVIANIQLAFLMADIQPTKLIESEGFINDTLLNRSWKDPQNFKEFHPFVQPNIDPYPFSFNAVLYAEKGEFPLEDIIDSMLASDMLMGLSGFSTHVGGPHGDVFENTLTFMLHDRSHWSDIPGLFEGCLESWIPFQNIARCLWSGKIEANPFLSVGLFMLLREGGQPDPSCLIKGLTSYKDIFNNWIAHAISMEKSNTTDQSMSVFCTNVMQKTLAQANSEYQFLSLSGDISESEGILTVGCIYYCDDDYNRCVEIKVDFSTINQPDWRMSELKAEHVKVFRGTPHSDELYKIVGSSVMNLSPKQTFLMIHNDHIKLMNHAYGKEVLSCDASSETIHQCTVKFYQEFYETYEGMLSDEPYESSKD